MDRLGLEVLAAEMADDARIAAAAVAQARTRFGEPHPGHLEAVAFELMRAYNVMERLLERICEACENHFERRGDYHERLLQRLALALPGIRPAFVPSAALPDLRELKGFRHVIRHAYDLVIVPERFAFPLAAAERVASSLPRWAEDFVRAVRTEQGWVT